jgi:tripartite-type tricarboxylate transporter receptor subunit TctC
MKYLSLLVILVISLFLVAGDTSAQSSISYPTRPIRMIVPFAPGGASDFVARIIQPKLSEVLGTQIVIDNRSGAAGNIGVEVAARAIPDGYTILNGNVGTMAINPSVFPNYEIKPMRDLIGITALTDVPGGLAIHPSIPAKTIKDFIAYAKTCPGKLNYGSAGASSSSRLAFEFFMAKAGINLMHVPYKGGAGAATIALISGEVQASLANVASFIPHLKTGKLKLIGVMFDKRLPSLPDIPTLAESGFPEMTAGSWQGIYVPVGTPRPIVNKLHSALSKVMQDPWVIDRLDKAERNPSLASLRRIS